MKIKIILSALILALSVAGCGGKEDKSDIKPAEERIKKEEAEKKNKDGEKKEEKITVLVPDYAVPPEKLVEDFTDEYGIVPEFEKIHWSKISEAVEYGDIETDVVQVDWTWVGKYKNMDLISPMSVSDEDEKAMPSIESFRIGDEIYAKPYFNDFKLGFYNQKHYSEAEISSPPETWDEVYRNSEKIRERNIARYPYHIVLNNTKDSAIDFISLAYSRNGKVFNEDGSFDYDSLKDTLAYIDMMYKRELISPDDEEIYISDDYRKIATGETSFMTGASSYIVGLNDKTKSSISGQVKDTRIPGKEGLTESILACPEGLAVMKNSDKKESAQKYIDWFTSEETQKKLFEYSNIIPSRINILEEIISSGAIKSEGAMIESAKMASSPIPDETKYHFQDIMDITAYSLYEMTKEGRSLEETAEFMDRTVRNVIAGNPVPEEVRETEN